MTHSSTERLTPGTATGVVFYITGAVLAVLALALVIAAGNDIIIISPEVQFGMFVLALASASGLSIVASAAVDKLFYWPKGGVADPPPPQMMPNIDWGKSDMAMMWNHYITAVVFAVCAVGLLIAGTNETPTFVFAPWFSFALGTTSLALAAGFLHAATRIHDSNLDGDIATLVGLWIISVVLAAISAALAICAGNGIVLFSPPFHFVVCIATLVAACYTYFHAGIEANLASIYMFVMAAVLAIVAVILAIVLGNSVVIFSAVFHVVLVGVLVFSAAVIAVYAGLITDRS